MSIKGLFIDQYQILWTNIIIIEEHIVRRVTNEILGVRGLNGYGVKAHTY